MESVSATYNRGDQDRPEGQFQEVDQREAGEQEGEKFRYGQK